MSKASKVINIFIFLFAIVVVAFGVLLFQKREDITQARTDTANTVQNVSTTLDPKAVIPAGNLMIEKTSVEVKTELVKLEELAKKIVKQRDTVAESYAEVANIVLENAYTGGKPLNKVESGSIAGYKSYEDTIEEIRKNVQNRMDYFGDRDKRIADFLDEVNGKLDTDERISQDNEELGKAFDEIVKEAEKKVTQMKTFRDHAKAVHGLVAMMDNGANLDDLPNDYPSAIRVILSRSADTPNLNSDTEYTNLLFTELKNLNSKVNEHKSLREQNELLSSITAKAQDEIASYAEKTKEAEDRAERAETLLAEAQKEIIRYQSIIDPTGFENEQENAARNIDYAALKDLVGKVVQVNKQYGFITINIGSESEVVRSTGEHILTPLPVGAVLTVATSLDPDDPNVDFVCKVQTKDVRAKAATATILASPGGSFTCPKVGDVVYFSRQDIEAVKAANEEAMRKKAEERAAAEREQALLELNDILTGEDEINDGLDLDDEGFLDGDDGMDGLDDEEDGAFDDFEEE